MFSVFAFRLFLENISKSRRHTNVVKNKSFFFSSLVHNVCRGLGLNWVRCKVTIKCVGIMTHTQVSSFDSPTYLFTVTKPSGEELQAYVGLRGSKRGKEEAKQKVENEKKFKSCQSKSPAQIQRHVYFVYIYLCSIICSASVACIWWTQKILLSHSHTTYNNAPRRMKFLSKKKNYNTT